MISNLYLKPTALTDMGVAMPVVVSCFVNATLKPDSPFIHTGMTQSLHSDSLWDQGLFLMYRQPHRLPPMEVQVVCLDNNENPVYATVIDPYGLHLFLKEIEKHDIGQLNRCDLQVFLKVRRILKMAAVFHFQIWIY